MKIKFEMQYAECLSLVIWHALQDSSNGRDMCSRFVPAGSANTTELPDTIPRHMFLSQQASGSVVLAGTTDMQTRWAT